MIILVETSPFSNFFKMGKKDNGNLWIVTPQKNSWEQITFTQLKKEKSKEKLARRTRKFLSKGKGFREER
jgi:hypothetical protein